MLALTDSDTPLIGDAQRAGADVLDNLGRKDLAVKLALSLLALAFPFPQNGAFQGWDYPAAYASPPKDHGKSPDPSRGADRGRDRDVRADGSVPDERPQRSAGRDKGAEPGDFAREAQPSRDWSREAQPSKNLPREAQPSRAEPGREDSRKIASADRSAPPRFSPDGAMVTEQSSRFAADHRLASVERRNLPAIGRAWSERILRAMTGKASPYVRVDWSNGWNEWVRADRYTLVDPKGRVVVNRPAGPADVSRLRAIADR